LSLNIYVLILISTFTCLAQNPVYVWSNPSGSGRQQKVLFRNSFEIVKVPEKAEISLFASSRYHIYINGTHLNFGPSRFYPANPQYDTFELVSYLKEGMNVIAVEVLANGMETFQIFESIGSLIAWGDIQNGKEKTHSLETPGSWKMLPVFSMDTLALKFSFACGAMELLDSQKEPFQWKHPAFDDSNWETPEIIAKQDYWGKLRAREIPHLTQSEAEAFRCLGIYDETPGETFYSFYQKTPDENQILYGRGERFAGYTWIYSPEEQELEIGTWWGEYYLNGDDPLNVHSIDPVNPVRENRIFNLKKGWNFLFVSYRAIWGAWEFLLAVPEESDLVFSPLKNEESQVFFKISSALNSSDTERFIEAVRSGETDPEKIIPQIIWKEHSNEIPFKNPVRDLVWKHPDLKSRYLPNDFKTGNFPVEMPKFFSFDMGRKMLGRIFIDITAPAGTIIDLGYSEDLNQSGLPYLYKRAQINSGAGFICDGKRSRYETFKPYGIRYLLVKVTPPPNTAATLHKIGVIEQIYPFEKKGNFECSDPMLNKIWEMGWRTLRVCSEDSYIDTPFRERGLYAGDALPEYAITLATSGDSRLMKKSLQLFQDMYRDEMLNGSMNRHNDFILKTLIELFWYNQYTGDSVFVKSLLPNYINYLNQLEKNKTAEGYYKVGQVFLEWTKIQKTADLTAYQALLHGSLKMMETLSGEYGYQKEKQTFHDRAESLRQAILTHFWDKEKGIFFDGYENEVKIDHHYPISVFYPLLFDVVSEKDQKDKLIRFLNDELKDIGEETRSRKTTPYGSFYLFAALYQNEEAGIAERFMKQYWSRMILQGDDTSWENFDINSEGSGGQGTASHAWSGHPTYFLSTRVLGVNLGFDQGFSRDTVFINPQSETLTWAKGTVPHPVGEVSVEWYLRGEILFLNVSVPSGVKVIVEPVGRLKKYKAVQNISYY
jgi:hypothetical protein